MKEGKRVSFVLAGAVVALVLRTSTALASSQADEPGDVADAEVIGVASGEHDVGLQVGVEPTIAGADRLRAWIEEDGHEVLRESRGNVPRRGTVIVLVEGDVFDYRVTVAASREGRDVSEPKKWDCVCSNEELLGRLREVIPQVAEDLEAKEIEEEVRSDDARTSVRSEAPREEVAPEPETTKLRQEPGRKPRMGAVGAAGLATIGVGAAGVAAGVTFLALGLRAPDSDRAYSSITARDYRPPGVVMMSVGAAVTLVGVLVFVLRDRIQDKRRSQHRTAGFVLRSRLGLGSVFTGGSR